jgi:uncharacterized membrane protein YczE
MNTQKRAFILYFLGLFIMPMGVIIMVRSNLGPPPLASLAGHVSSVLPITLGTASFLLQAIIVSMVLIIRKDKKAVFIFVAATLLGFGLDFWGLFLNSYTPETMATRVISFFIGLFILSFGQNMVRYSEFKATPLLEYMKLYQMAYKTEHILIPRLSVEGSLLAFSFILAFFAGLGFGNIGPGTLILLFGMPFFLAAQNQWMYPLFHKKNAKISV